LGTPHQLIGCSDIIEIIPSTPFPQLEIQPQTLSGGIVHSQDPQQIEPQRAIKLLEMRNDGQDQQVVDHL
jgi:hypothetical protein